MVRHVGSERRRRFAFYSLLGVAYALAGSCGGNSTSHSGDRGSGANAGTHDAGTGGDEPTGDDSGTSGAAGKGGMSGNGSGGVAGTAGGTTGGSTTGGSTTGGNGTGGLVVAPCNAGRPWAPGIDLCEGEYVHRHTVERCPEPEWDSGEGGRSEDVTECVKDADCPNGTHCVAAPGYTTDCIAPQCETDEDCDGGFICVCAPGYELGETGREVSFGTCVRAACRSDAVCPPPYQCSSPMDFDDLDGFHCQTSRDNCWGDGNCNPSEGNDDCIWQTDRFDCF
jgi:hypothetical protein